MLGPSQCSHGGLWFRVSVCRKDRSGMSGLQVVYGIAMGKWASLEVVINTRIELEPTCKVNSNALHTAQVQLLHR